MQTMECVDWKTLDAEFSTPPISPLHHDNRCKDCK
jgi:hypothetical protein